MDLISLAELSALVQVVLVDLVLAGDNAIVVAMAVVALPPELRARGMIAGIAVATILRVIFATLTVTLLQVIGLVLAGGILLLWVSWKLWRDLREQMQEDQAAEDIDELVHGEPLDHPDPPRKSLREAVVQIVVADVSMSLDNVLAVAGIAREHAWVLIVGLTLSIAFMGLAAVFLARLLARHHWIGYVGLAVIFYVALTMMWDGMLQVMAAMG